MITILSLIIFNDKIKQFKYLTGLAKDIKCNHGNDVGGYEHKDE